MRKFTFALTLIALLVVSTAVVYAGVAYAGDPHIGAGFWLAWTVSVDGASSGWTPDVQYDADVEQDDGDLEAEATVWLSNADEGISGCSLEVRLHRGKGGPVLAQEDGSCDEKVEVEWESD